MKLTKIDLLSIQIDKYESVNIIYLNNTFSELNQKCFTIAFRKKWYLKKHFIFSSLLFCLREIHHFFWTILLILVNTILVDSFLCIVLNKFASRFLILKKRNIFLTKRVSLESEKKYYFGFIHWVPCTYRFWRKIWVTLYGEISRL